MTRIGLISDTHSYLDPAVIKYLKEVDLILHAGDIGSGEVLDALKKIKPVLAVYGNIDGAELRSKLPLVLRTTIEKVEILMTHIAGYPGKYNSSALALLNSKEPRLFICGHSHILKVIYDKQYKLLHMNPGAAGIYGIHKIQTLLRFSIHEEIIKDLEIVEFGRKNKGHSPI